MTLEAENSIGDKHAVATFAGGCFWCMEPPFDNTRGVLKTEVGYTGGRTADPTYEEISSGRTGHAEAIRLIYDPEVVGYEDLLRVFWENIDPTALNRQFADVGTQYRTAIFYHTPEQRKLAEESKQKLQESVFKETPIVTEITEASEFFVAEDYHQEYYKKNAVHYKLYKKGSGREDYINTFWKKK